MNNADFWASARNQGDRSLDSEQNHGPVPLIPEPKTFENVPLKNIAAELGSVYHVTIEVKNAETAALRLYYPWNPQMPLQQVIEELKQLKSTDIKSVDIITSPGAKYNAEVGAVIRIKTIKRQDDGLSIEAYTQTKYNDWWTNYEDFTVKYRSGGLEVFGTGSFYNHHYSEDPVLSSELLFNNNPIHIDQTAPNSDWFTSVYGKAGLSYDFDENNSIGMTYGCFGELYGGGDMNGSQTIYRNGQLEGRVSQWMKIDHRTIPDHDANQYTRDIGISLQYNFNATRSKYKGTGAGNAEKSRL